MLSLCRKSKIAAFAIGLAFICISLLGITNASAITYLPYAAWYDANKDWSGDLNLCWAGTASNILAWGQWGTPALSNEHLIFYNFEDHWTDKGSLMHVAWWWWFYGNYPAGYPYGSSWATVDVPGGGGHYPGVTWSSYFHEYWGNNTMWAIDNYLHAGYGVGLAIYREWGHAVTAWGYEYDPAHPDYYTGIWITDSDDNVTALRYYALNKIDNRWYFANYGGAHNIWHIDGVQALGPIPEPGALLLLGSSLLGFGIVNKLKRKKK